MPDREKVISQCKQAIDSGEPVTNYYFYYKVIALLQEQEEQKIRELSINEWEEWKANPKRNPICVLWKNDTSPMWILNPDKVHEPALLMGELKLFTGKPTFEQCKAVKWNE